MDQNPAKVVHSVYYFLPLTQNWIYNQVAGLDETETMIYAFARENKESFSINNLRCLREDLGRFSLFFNLAWNELFHWYPQILLWFWRDRVDLIHAHFGMQGCHMLLYASLLNIPLITSFYGVDAYMFSQRARWRNKYKRLFKQGRLFLAEGPAMREKLIEIGCPPEKIIIHQLHVIP